MSTFTAVLGIDGAHEGESWPYYYLYVWMKNGLRRHLRCHEGELKGFF